MNTDTLNRKSIHVVEFIGEKAVCESIWVFKWVILDSLWLKKKNKQLQKYKYKYGEMKARKE